MKNAVLFFSTILLSALCIVSNAQVTSPEDSTKAPGEELTMTPDKYTGFYIGLEFLPTFTNFQVHQINGDLFDTKAVPGYGVGVQLGYDFFEHFAFQGELLYSALAQRYFDNRNVERNIHLNYVSVPLLFVFNTDNTEPINLTVAAGPQIGFLVSSSFDSTGTVQGDTISAVFGAKSADFGIAYGAGIDFRLSKVISVGIGYRGVIGVVDISDKSLAIDANEYYLLDRSHVITYAGYAAIRFKL